MVWSCETCVTRKLVYFVLINKCYLCVFANMVIKSYKNDGLLFYKKIFFYFNEAVGYV